MTTRGKYYNRTGTCDKCKIGKLEPHNAFREYNKRNEWTGIWLCKKCLYDPIIRSPKQYNLTNTCEICGDKLVSESSYREKDDQGIYTGRWICKKCKSKEYRKFNGNLWYDDVKRITTDFRNNKLSIDSNTGKGYISQIVTCKVRGVKDLNIEYDNFSVPIDHSIDRELGIIQSKSSTYDPYFMRWKVGTENEQNKKIDYVFIYCMSEDNIDIERLYIIPKDEIIFRKHIVIYKSSKRVHWYDKYRVDEEPYNHAYHNLDENDLKILKNSKKKMIIVNGKKI